MSEKKYIVFGVRDGTTWGLPAEIVAMNRAKYYAQEYSESYVVNYVETLGDDYELVDWAGNNMDWDDIKPHIVKLADPLPMRDIDYHLGWQEASLQVIEKKVSEEDDGE